MRLQPLVRLDKGTRMQALVYSREKMMNNMIFNDSMENLAANEAKIAIDG